MLHSSFMFFQIFQNVLANMEVVKTKTMTTLVIVNPDTVEKIVMWKKVYDFVLN